MRPTNRHHLERVNFFYAAVNVVRQKIPQELQPSVHWRCKSNSWLRRSAQPAARPARLEGVLVLRGPSQFKACVPVVSFFEEIKQKFVVVSKIFIHIFVLLVQKVLDFSRDLRVSAVRVWPLIEPA